MQTAREMLTEEEYTRLTSVLNRELRVILEKVIDVAYEQGYSNAIDFARNLIKGE